MTAQTSARPGGFVKRFWLPALVILLALLLPMLTSVLDLGAIGLNMTAIIVIAVYIMLALGLNIVVGFAGLLDLGFVAFFAIGAYVMGWLASAQFSQVSFNLFSTAPVVSVSGKPTPGIHISFWLIIFIAAMVTALCGVIIGAPTLRLRGDYLAIVTLGFGEIIPRFFQNGDDIFGFNLTNGTIGIQGIDSPGLPLPFPGWDKFGPIHLTPWYYTILAMIFITIWVSVRLRDSKLGRAWMAVREDEVAAASMGVNLVSTKLWAYAMGAVFGGMAGAFYGAFIKSIFPTSFAFNISILILSMVILGGMGNIYGVILGAITLQYINFALLPRLSYFAQGLGLNIDLPKYNFFLFGVLLVLVMLLRPEGILPNRQRAEELHEGDGGDALGDPSKTQ